MATKNTDQSALFITNRMLQRQAIYGKTAAEVINSEKWSMLIEGFQSYRMFDGNIYEKPNHITYMFEALTESLYSTILKALLPYAQHNTKINEALQKIVTSSDIIHYAKTSNLVIEKDPTIIDDQVNAIMYIWGHYSTIEVNLNNYKNKNKEISDEHVKEIDNLLNLLGFYENLDEYIKWIHTTCEINTTKADTYPRNPTTRENKKAFQEWEKSLFRYYSEHPDKIEFSDTPNLDPKRPVTIKIEDKQTETLTINLTPMLKELLDTLNITKEISVTLLPHFNSEQEHFYESLFNQHIPNSIKVFSNLTTIGDDTTEAEQQFAGIITQSNDKLTKINEQVRDNIRKESSSHFSSTSTIINGDI